MPIFRVKSVKIYTGQKKFTQAPPMAPVTNMRYVPVMQAGHEEEVTQVGHCEQRYVKLGEE